LVPVVLVPFVLLWLEPSIEATPPEPPPPPQAARASKVNAAAAATGIAGRSLFITWTSFHRVREGAPNESGRVFAQRERRLSSR
jgi:hypothetical protein